MAGVECCSNPPTLNPAGGGGHVTELCGFSTYITGSPASRRSILLISDVFGYENPNLRNLADKVAAAGFHVVVPDFLYGDPFTPGKLPISDWIKSHGPDKAFDDAKPIIEYLKDNIASCVGVAGFCWGAKVVVKLAKGHDIQAAVLLHPSFVTVDDIKEVKVPISIQGAEIDKTSPPELLKQFEEILAAKSEVSAYVKIFPNVSHGWTVRFDEDDAVAVEKAKEAHANMLEWFDKYVK